MPQDDIETGYGNIIPLWQFGLTSLLRLFKYFDITQGLVMIVADERATKGFNGYWVKQPLVA